MILNNIGNSERDRVLKEFVRDMLIRGATFPILWQQSSTSGIIAIGLFYNVNQLPFFVKSMLPISLDR